MTTTLTLLISAACFLSYLWMSHSRTIGRRFSRISGTGGDSTRRILFQRFSGVIWLGIVPAFIVMVFPLWQVGKLGLRWNVSFSSLFWTLGLASLAFLFNLFFSQRPQNLKNYPQISEHVWTAKTVALNVGSWLVYLAAYEFLIRGFLLFTLESTWGFWAAILVVTAFYALAHLHKGLGETTGAIPFGIILGYLALQSGSFWPAFAVHAVLAVSNELLAFAGHPEMRIQKRM